MRNLTCSSHFLVESGTQGLHYCRLGPYDDEPIPESMMETAARLKQEGIRYAKLFILSPALIQFDLTL